MASAVNLRVMDSLSASVFLLPEVLISRLEKPIALSVANDASDVRIWIEATASILAAVVVFCYPVLAVVAGYSNHFDFALGLSEHLDVLGPQMPQLPSI